MDPFRLLISGLSLGAVYALISVGYALIFNVLKFSNFSHGSLMGVSAYAGYFFSTLLGDIPVPAMVALTLLACILSGAVFSFIIERMAFWQLRKKHSDSIYYFISSITIGVLFENLINLTYGNNFYSYPFNISSITFQVGGVTIALTNLLMLCISIVVLVVLMFVIFKTRIGTAMRAVSLDTVTASLMGVNVNSIVVGTFLVSGMLAGTAGLFLGINYTLYPQLGSVVVKGFIASVIGGLGSIVGAVIGAVLLGIVEIILITTVGSASTPIFEFLVMLGFLLIRPRGIAGVVVHEKV